MKPVIGYVMTHYPATSHTFIAREIAGLRAAGVAVRPFAINPHRAADVMTDEDRAAVAETSVLKQVGAAGAARIFAAVALRHPLALARTVRLAGQGCGLDLGRRLRRAAQAGEGVILAQWARPDRIRHFHAHFGQAPANIAWFAAAFATFAGRASSWSMTIHGPQDCINEPPHLLAAKVEAASFVVAVADYTKAQLIRQIPESLWPKVHVVRCGVPLPSGDGIVAPHPRTSPPTVLMVARLSPEKGLPVAFEAMAELQRRGVEFRADVVGPGDWDRDVAPVVDRLGLGNLVHWIGAVPPREVAARMATADVLCLPSFAEGLPTVAIEAMYVGAVVVGSGISGVPELVVHGETGLLVPPARADLLADAMAKVLADPDTRTRMAERARQIAVQCHDPRVTVPQLESLFAEVGAIAGHDRR